jgi:hypothetical protein
MHRRRKSLIIIASVILGLAASGSYALAELSVAPPQAQPTLSVAQPQPQPPITVAEPAPQPPVSVSTAPSSPASAPAPTPQPAAAPPTPQAPALQPAATAPEVQPAATTAEVQPAATAPEIQPATSAPAVQPAATTPDVQPAATATPPASSPAPSTPAPPINPSSTVAVAPASTAPPATSTSAAPSIGETVAKDAAGNADVPANAAKKILHGRASDAGRTLRKSDSAAARSQAAKDLPRFGKTAELADRAATGVTILGAASGAATDYQGQRAAGHSSADSAGYATTRQAGGVAGAVAASALCVPADAVSLGFAEAGCLFVGNAAGNLAGGWIYDLARKTHDDPAAHSSSNSHPGTPNPNTTVKFVLPL